MRKRSVQYRIRRKLRHAKRQFRRDAERARIAAPSQQALEVQP